MRRSAWIERRESRRRGPYWLGAGVVLAGFGEEHLRGVSRLVPSALLAGGLLGAAFLLWVRLTPGRGWFAVIGSRTVARRLGRPRPARGRDHVGRLLVDDRAMRFRLRQRGRRVQLDWPFEQITEWHASHHRRFPLRSCYLTFVTADGQLWALWVGSLDAEAALDRGIRHAAPSRAGRADAKIEWPGHRPPSPN